MVVGDEDVLEFPQGNIGKDQLPADAPATVDNIGHIVPQYNP
jgi:hypothetical protein